MSFKGTQFRVGQPTLEYVPITNVVGNRRILVQGKKGQPSGKEANELAQTIVHRVNTYDQIVEALEPLAAIADVIGQQDPNAGLWSEQSNFREPVRLLVKHALQAKAALEAAKRGGGDDAK